MLRSVVTALALVAVLPAAGESLNHTTGTQGLLLIDKLGGHVRFLDPATFAERSDLELPKNPHDFALSADHQFAYVPIYGPGVYNRNPEPGHELYVLDLVERKLARVIDLAPYRSPHGVQIDARGLVYVTAELDRKILVVDPAAGRVVAAVDHEGSGHWLAVLPDGSKAYVANKDEIMVVDTATDTVLDRITLAGTTDPAYQAYYSPDGKWLLTMAGSTINLFDAADLRAPQRTVKVGASPMGIAFSADGKTALVANRGDARSPPSTSPRPRSRRPSKPARESRR